MNCVNHPETPAEAYCRVCGKALCAVCQRREGGTIYCAEHVPPSAAPEPPPTLPYGAPYSPPPGGRDVSPALAFLLGLIPGVGAIYNEQYGKGLLHVLIFGLIVSILNSDAAGPLEPMLGLLLAVFFFYMAFEAYHTAKKRHAGEPVEEFSSLLPLQRSGFPLGPVLLIALGVIFLLHNLEILRFYRIVRYWPVLLIMLGAYMLYLRMTAQAEVPGSGKEAGRE